MYDRRSTNTYSHHQIYLCALVCDVLSSTAVDKLCTLFEFRRRAAHAPDKFLFFCVHSTRRILLVCFPAWLQVAAAAVAAAAGSELSMLNELLSNHAK